MSDVIMTATTMPAPATGHLRGVGMTLGSMSLVQVGLAASTGLFDRLTPAGTTWLRLSWAAVILVVVVRPKPWRYSGRDLLGVVLLGLASGSMTLMFAESVARIPMGAASAIGFLGPLTVGVVRRTGRFGLLWPPIAFGGVILVTQPWHGSINLAGLLFAFGNAAAWAMYVVLTQKVGDKLPGLSGLALSMVVAAVVSAFAGAADAIPRLTPDVVLLGAGLALLLPVLPYALEMLALRRMAVGAFGTMLSLEPALATVTGVVFLHQIPNAGQLLGILAVTVAAIGAARAGARRVEAVAEPAVAEKEEPVPTVA